MNPTEWQILLSRVQKGEFREEIEANGLFKIISDVVKTWDPNHEHSADSFSYIMTIQREGQNTYGRRGEVTPEFITDLSFPLWRIRQNDKLIEEYENAIRKLK